MVPAFFLLGNEQLSTQLRKRLEIMIRYEEPLERPISVNLPEHRSHRVRRNKRISGKEFRIDAQVADSQMKKTMLDLGSDVNILPKNTW